MWKRLIHWLCGRQKTKAFLYDIQGSRLAGVFGKEGNLILHCKRTAPPGTIPIREPLELFLTIRKEHLPVIAMWFANIDVEQGVSYVEPETLYHPAAAGGTTISKK